MEIKVLEETKLDLAEKVKKQEQHIKRLERTIPIELYEKGKIVENGEIKNISIHEPFAIMEMNASHFSKQVQGRSLEAVLNLSNSLLTKVIPYVYENNGLINSFKKAGFVAFYEKSCESALKAAISISEIIEETKNSELIENFAVGLSYGMVLAGMAGTEHRNSLITVSVSADLAKFLRSIARKYSARVLITGTLKQRIEEFERKFHSRKLGYIYITETDSLEEVFDVYDGESVQTRKEKQKTKIVFEKGVDFYTKGEYEKARQYFIEVCKTNRYDDAAKEYLKRCDENLVQPELAKSGPQIEEF
ncbi:hypothetical protein [[Clostridium] polysaccharolyticum]|uniref:hypothetical protein n=1 Tax=[Clostridium] polysaccharolyticum TaxID=29364 RepID=UPI001A9A4A73|nr:hypothetical protein [[Clostridium] polysaccharolyticum]